MVDPLITQSFQYAYSANNPIIYVDINGLAFYIPVQEIKYITYRYHDLPFFGHWADILAVLLRLRIPVQMGPPWCISTWISSDNCSENCVIKGPWRIYGACEETIDELTLFYADVVHKETRVRDVTTNRSIY